MSIKDMNHIIIGVLLLLFFLLIGEMVNKFIIGIIPSSVIGMILLFISLQLKLVKEELLDNVVNVIMSNLSLLFVAPAVGILAVGISIKEDIVAIIIAITASTIITLIVVGLITQRIGRRKNGRNFK